MLIPVPEDNERQVVCSIALNSGITSQQLHEGDTTITTALGNGNIGLYLKDSRVLNVTRKLTHSNTSATSALARPGKLTEHWVKTVACIFLADAPIVILNLGAPLDANNLLKGSDVYLECDVRANPSITRVEWYHNVSLPIS